MPVNSNAPPITPEEFSHLLRNMFADGLTELYNGDASDKAVMQFATLIEYACLLGERILQGRHILLPRDLQIAFDRGIERLRKMEPDGVKTGATIQ